MSSFLARNNAQSSQICEGDKYPEKKRKKMEERSVPSGMGKKARVHRQTLPAVQLDAGAGLKLEAVRHHGFSRSAGISGTMCAVKGPRGSVHSLEPLSSQTAMHFSGDASDTRPLQPTP